MTKQLWRNRAWILALLVFALPVIVCYRIGVGPWLGSAPPPVYAQAPQPVTQLLDVEKLQFSWKNTPTILAVRNLGQSAHTVFIPPATGGGAGCSIILQASGDTATWTSLAVLPHVASWALPVTIFGSGSFPYYRIVANPHYSTCATSGLFYVYYVGYQFGPPIVVGSENFTGSASTVALVFPSGTDVNPYQPVGGQCYNPDGATAYLQLYDAASSPGIGTGYFYQIGVAGTTYIDLNFHSFVGDNLLWSSATTTAGGSTAVSTPLVCNFQVNRRGPFGSFAGN